MGVSGTETGGHIFIQPLGVHGPDKYRFRIPFGMKCPTCGNDISLNPFSICQVCGSVIPKEEEQTETNEDDRSNRRKGSEEKSPSGCFLFQIQGEIIGGLLQIRGDHRSVQEEPGKLQGRILVSVRGQRLKDAYGLY